ncbi:MAG TPA: tRNA epoxyqueuosine(34) reductase QueG [Vitreimonas sp.]|uniref:tRNA epoxyqueuosine(34) reductase QueG n=1 Tax=Vitreimonas sp. TaxID=3069702 RepID=UPI002D545F77|nr:tRNA epoxyqueuosine(34) reductase QueG [Vitreimonas sp.]HYD87711.1 tRNA epoxyqueuosine(34) reductase QueG [Vitreimonas sp.]
MTVALTIAKADIAARAHALGFDAFGVASAREPWPAGARLEHFIADGRHGDMDWLAREAHRRSHPQQLWPEAKSVIIVGQSYAPDDDPMTLLAEQDKGVVSAYAARRDYHDVVKGKLKQLAQWLAHASGEEVKVFVDTAPLMEKPLAERAGIGWQGKHTNLVSREHGSWLFLGAILTAAEFEPDAPHQERCGSCRACLDVCPTDAFPAPFQLDARKCLAYLSIEHHGQIPRAYRAPMGNRIFGCDDCLAVCPWNKFAAASAEVKLQARSDLIAPRLEDLVRLGDADFRQKFSGSPIKRIGRGRFVRNVLIAIGNSGEPALAAEAERLLDDAEPEVRGAAVWALSRLKGRAELSAAAARRMAESDPDVLAEWRAALGEAA